jgi:hypothetical protein
VRAALLLGTIALAAACRRPADRRAPVAADTTDTAVAVVAAVTTDTLRGTLTEVGSEPSSIVLTPQVGSAVVLRGAIVPLRGVVGTDVVVRGRLTGERTPIATPTPAPVFEVSSFIVRAAGGVTAHDGVLRETGGRVYLVREDSTTVEIPALPPTLRAQIGARVYLAGPLDRPPAAYGIIVPAR